MGLFDAVFANPEATNALAAGLLSGNFGAGLLGMNQVQAQQRRERMAEQEMAMRKSLHDAQIANYQSEAEQRNMKVREAQRIQGVLDRARLQAQGTPGTAAVNDALPPEMRIGAQPPMPGRGINYQDLLFQNIPHELVKNLADARNWGRDEVARTEDAMNDKGQPVKRQFSKFGDQVGGDLPQWKAPVQVDQGNQTSFVNPVTMQPMGNFRTFVSPNTAASVAATMRGQDLTDKRSREANDIQRNAQRSQIIDTPNGPILVDKGTGGAQPVMLGGAPVKGDAQMKRESGAGQVIALLDQAEKILPKATNSFAGAGVDLMARGVGIGTGGAQAVGQLKAIEGALLGQMPRMEGPQSNYDVQMYKQAAGQLGDPTVPSEIKQAAINTIREIQQRYAGQPTAGSGGASGSWTAPSGTSGTWSVKKVP